MTISKDDILSVTRSVTKKWTKQRKAEDRGSRPRSSRMYIYSDRVYFTEVAEKIIPGAYLHASGNGRLPASKRQIYYACREEFKNETGRQLDYSYFAGTLLVQYLNRHPETASWKITADPRGTLTIPKKSGDDVRIPCGTIQIDEHLSAAECKTAKPSPLGIAGTIPTGWPSVAHGERYQAVLYIEKEGFEPLLQEANIAERFDLAILSCKGQSVVAARKYIDHVCRVGGGVPLFVVHDFDKAGFEISQRLTKVSDWARDADRVTYEFRNKINVTDLGLRLADVENYELQSESCDFKGGFARDSICTPEEREFLRSGRRVELNAFTSPQFIEWLEAKLAEYLPKRLIPDDDVLADAWRRALIIAEVTAAAEKAVMDADEKYRDAKAPKTLRRMLANKLKDSPEQWDEALYALALARSKVYPKTAD